MLLSVKNARVKYHFPFLTDLSLNSTFIGIHVTRIQIIFVVVRYTLIVLITTAKTTVL